MLAVFCFVLSCFVSLLGCYAFGVVWLFNVLFLGAAVGWVWLGV